MNNFIKTFLILLLLGFIGILALIPTLSTLIEQQIESIPNMPDIPQQLLIPLSLINPLILLILAIIIGMLTAPKVQLKSYVYNWIYKKTNGKSSFKSNVGLGIILGFVVGFIFVCAEFLFQPYLPEVLKTTSGDARDFVTTLSGVFYGGITEELLLRWGVMSLFVWIFWKLFQRSKSVPSSSIYWIGIILSALLFALGHYAATALITPVTTIIWIRMILLNGLGAVVFGWLYWKKGLEISFISHACTHIAITLFIKLWFLIL